MKKHVLLLAICLSWSAAWAGDGFVLGGGAVEQPLDETMAQVEQAHRLGATHFNIQVALCQTSKTSNEVFWCDGDRMSALDASAVADYKARVLRLARELKTRGFTTGLFPMLLSKTDGAWRGFFEPTDFKAWGDSYLERLRELAELAVEGQITELIAATELVHIYIGKNADEQAVRNAYWRRVSAELHRRLGPATSVIIVANWDQFEEIPFWDASDYIAVSAYYPLADSDKDDTSVAALTSRWSKWQPRLAKVAERFHKQLYFSEVGYASESNAAHEPWGWEGTLDLELQRRLYAAFANAWTKSAYSPKLARFLLWALDVSSDPAHDTGFDVIGKPAEAPLSEAFQERLYPKASGEKRVEIPVLFTIDDLPMWFVSDVSERLASYAAIRETLARHHVPGVAFANAGFITDGEWTELRSWRDQGLVFANHTSHHKPRSTVSEAEFLAEVDSDEQALKDHGLAPAVWFRYPNLDYGANGADSRATCEAIRARGYSIMPTSFDTRDWSWAESYHKTAAATIDARPEQGRAAQAIAAKGLSELESRFVQTPSLAPSALILMMHSTRFGRDYLDNILTRLELRGARWVAPNDADHGAYGRGDDCLPACRAKGQCN